MSCIGPRAPFGEFNSTPKRELLQRYRERELFVDALFGGFGAHEIADA